jgi:hypothetical protein
METVKPLAPWHGYWFLVSPSGNFAPARARLIPSVLPSGSRVLSVVMDANVSPVDVTLYNFGGVHSRVTVCAKECSLNWIPLLTHGTPVVGRGINSRLVGTRQLSDGAEQVTYRGQPLFLYAEERVFLTPSVHLRRSGTAGNGNALPVSGGTLSLTMALP